MIRGYERAGRAVRRCGVAMRVPMVVATAIALAGTGSAQQVRQDFYVTGPNSTVYAMAKSGNTLYIGGNFSQVGPPTGSGVPVDPATGLPSGNFPRVTGTVHAVVPDGSGGWYIGGDFTAVGGISRL